MVYYTEYNTESIIYGIKLGAARMNGILYRAEHGRKAACVDGILYKVTVEEICHMRTKV
jgi:hypothetical protein